MTEADVRGRGPGVVLLPGGASTSLGYFPHLASTLSRQTTVVTFDPKGIGQNADHEPLRLKSIAGEVAGRVANGGVGPCVLVGHSLGALTALQTAESHPEAVAALVLLDPSPLMPAQVLSAFSTALKAYGMPGPLPRMLWKRAARSQLGNGPFDPEQQQAIDVYLDPAFAKQASRWAAHLAGDGAELARAVERDAIRVPTVIVTASSHKPSSPMRQSHTALSAAIQGSLHEIWEHTEHPLHILEPSRVGETVRRMLTLQE